MFKLNVMQRIVNTGAMAIVRTNTVERGIEIAEGCLNGGVDIIDILFRMQVR